VTYDHWKATEPDPYAHEPVGECHWCGHRAVLYRTWLCYPVEASRLTGPSEHYDPRRANCIACWVTDAAQAEQF
jgi:hypothetical protein